MAVPDDSESKKAKAMAGEDAGNESRFILEAIIESSDDAIVSKDLTGVVLSWNAAAEKIFGYSAAEMIGQPMVKLFPPDRVQEEQEILRKIVAGDKVSHFETYRVHKDGRPIHVSVSLSPIKNTMGRIIGASKIARDISNQSRSEQELNAAVRELQDITAALDEHSIVAVTDAAGRITSVNDKFCAISKYSRSELIGRDHRIINSGHHSKDFFRDLWTTIKSGLTWHGEILNRAKDGTLYWVDTTIYPRCDELGRPMQFVAIRTDITRRKADEEEIARVAADLAEKNKELEAIVYTVSHDLRSPLVNVQGFSRLLSRACEKIQLAYTKATDGTVPASELIAPVEVAIPQSMKFINAGVRKMEMLLDGLLRYSRIGRLTISLQNLDMDTLVAEVIAAVRFQLDEAKTELEISPLPPCRGDREQVIRVFANLVDNAVKYRDAARALKISIRGELDGPRVLYAVQDTGVGISAAHQPKIFDIFHRLNPDTSSGEGLGLTIAQRLLERQGGKIWVESAEGKGSTFLVSLPGTK